MYVVAGFESNEYLEIAILQLTKNEVKEKDIVVIPIEPANEQDENVLDSINHSDGISLIDGITAWGMMGMLFGAIYGSQLRVGPVAIGLLGGIAGCIVGYLLDRRKSRRGINRKKSNCIDFLLIIRCEDERQIKKVKSVCSQVKVVALGEHISKKYMGNH